MWSAVVWLLSDNVCFLSVVVVSCCGVVVYHWVVVVTRCGHQLCGYCLAVWLWLVVVRWSVVGVSSCGQNLCGCG